MKLNFELLIAALSATTVVGLSDYAKNNVRKNFGEDNRFVVVNSEEVSDVFHSLLKEHDMELIGSRNGKQHLKVSTQGMEALVEEGVSFSEHTEEFLSNVERNLNSEGFVCLEGAQTCGSLENDEFYNSYQTLDSLIARYENLVEQYPEQTRFETLGLTYEGREQKLLWIGDDAEKPLVYHFCAVHAREWITPLYCMHLAETLLDPTNEKAQKLLKDFSFVITPVANPDGYVYSHEVDTAWRKTRQPTSNPICVGTDPNRNYDYEWGGEGASPNPCNDAYRGVAPFDQNITFNIKTFTDTYANRLIHVNDVHAYGEYYLSPWAYTVDLPPVEDYVKQEATNQALYDAIEAFSGLQFKVGPTAQTIYPASGGSMDYFYGVNGIIYSGSYEARSADYFGLQGFQPPVENIVPSNLELFEGTYAFLRKIVELELCGDLEETNIFWENKEEGSDGGLVMAECQELEPYCSIYPQVQQRCPSTCSTCDERFRGDEVPILRIGGEGIAPETTEDSESSDETLFLRLTGFVLLGSGLVLVGIISAMLIDRKLKKKTEQEVPSTIQHYTATI